MHSLKFNFTRIAFACLLLTVGFASTASAVQSQFQILLNLDNNVSTGCDVPTLTGMFPGAEQILITTVNTTGSSAAVTAVETRTCITPATDTFGPPTPIITPPGRPLPWPVGVSNGTGGTSVIETFYPLSAGPPPGPAPIIRLGVLGFNATNTLVDELVTTQPGPGNGPPILMQIQGGTIGEIPTLSEWGLILLALLLAGMAVALMKRRTRAAFLAALLLLCGAGLAWAAACDLDGTTTGEWSAALLLASESVSDAPAGADIRAFYGCRDGALNGICFRIDAELLYNQPPVANDQNVVTNEDTPVGITLTGSDPDGNPLTFTIVTPPANGMLTGTAPNVTYTPNPNYNGPDSFTFQVDDGQGSMDTGTVSITVSGVNDPPSITSPAAVSVPENQTAVIDVQSTDPEGETEGAGLTYSLTGGADLALFSINPATGVLTFNSAPDFEAPGDAGANNVYDVQVTVTDSGTLTAVQNLQVTVTNTPDPPMITSPAAVNVPENQTAVIDVQSVDPEGETEGAGLTYSLTGGADVALFSIVPATGVLTFNSAPDFESPGDAGADNVYDVQVTVSDSTAQTGVQNLQVTVTDVNEAPEITSPAAVSVPEGQTAVIDVQSTDPEGDTEGAGLTYSLTGGADQALFSIVPATGVLTFNSAPDFEAPGDAGANNVYDVQVTVTDSGAQTGVQNLQVTVTDTLEPPTITTPAAVSVPENQTAVIDVQSTDPDGDTEGGGLTYSLTGGADVALFSIVPATGVLTFNSPPNFEAPGDAGGNNVYDVQVTVTDSDTQTAVQNLQVTVTDALEAPSITSAAAVSVPENQTAVIDIQSTDPDGDTEGSGLTYSLTGGADVALFSIVPATGVLTFNSPPNFEVPGDAGGNNVYDVQVTVTDSDTLTGVQNLQVTVTNVNEAPSITSAAAVSVPENQTAVIDVQSTDPDGETEGAGLTYSLTGGADQALFSIVPATGVLTFNSPPNFEAPGDAGANNVYDVQVTVTDAGALTGVQNLQVTVTDVSEAPTITSAAAVSVPENQTAVIDVQSTDPDGDTEGSGLTYSLTGGADQALFSIVPATGVLTFNSPPNFEAPGDAGGNNVYDVQVTVTDSDTLTGVQNLQVTVTDASEPPSITSPAAVSIPENQAAVIDVQSTDPDGDTEGSGLTYSLTGGADQALFSIIPATGVLTFNSAPDFENPLDAGANNVYDVQVTVTDSDTLTGVQNLQVTVTNVNEPPTASPDVADITEEAPNVAALNTVSGNVLTNDTDPDSVLTVSAVAGGSVGSPRAGTYGSVTINSNGSYTYTLDDTNPAVNALLPGGTLVESFGYTASDGSFTSSSTLMVTIHGADDPATPDNDAHDFIGNTQLEVDRDTATTPEVIANTPANPAELGVLDGDIDPDGGAPLAIAGIVGCGDLTAPFDCVLPGQGTISLHADGSFSFIPEAGDTDPTASFQYTLVGNPAPATVTLTRFERVWYVKNDAPAGGNGTSSSPFNSITAANLSDNDSDGDLTDDLDFAGDYIFVYFGTGTAANQSGGLVLENNQHLIGQHAGLSLNVNLNGNGAPTNLVAAAAGSRPHLDDTVVDAFEGVSARNVIPAEIVGMNLAGNVNAIDWTTTAAFAGTGAFVIRDNVVRSAANEGVDINLVGTGATRLAFHDNNLTATSNGLDIQETGTGTLTITAFDDNVVTGNTGGTGVYISNAVFDSVPGGTLDPVNGGTTIIGEPGNPVGTNLTHGSLWMETVTGSLSFTDLDIYAAGFGLTVVGTGPFTGAAGTSIQVTPAPPDNTGTSTMVANDGAAVAISNATVDLRLAGLTSTPTTFSTSGVEFVNVAGQFRAPSGSSITKVSGIGQAFGIDNSAAGTTVLTSVYNGTINNSSATARAIRINNADSGSSSVFTGSVAETGQGVSLTNNTGASVSFSGGLSASTGANAAFTATGGGTIEVCDENPCNGGATGALVNTLTTTTGTALNVANTTISANNLEFRSISANGAPNGIILNATGANGSLRVNGNGGSCTSAATCTGGAIQATTGDGVSLTSTRAPSLARMFISGSGGHGINATNVNTGLTLTNSFVTNSGNADNEYGLNLSNLTGTAAISGTTFNNAADDLVHFVNTNTNGNLTVNGSSSFVYPGAISGTANAGIAIQPNGTSNVTVTVQNSTFTNIRSDSIQWGAATAGSNGTSTLDFSNNTITVNTAGRASGFSLSCQESTTGNITIANNNFSGAGGNGVISIDCNDSSLITGSISGNTITNPPGIGLFVAVDEASEARLTINGNTVTNSGGDGIQVVNFGGVGVSDLYLAITNNQVNGHSANTGVSFVGGISTTSFEDNTCIELRGNAVTGTPASPTQCGGAPCVDYYIEEVGGAMTFEEVPNTASTTLNAAYVNSTNDAGPVTIFGTIDLTNGAQCPFP